MVARGEVWLARLAPTEGPCLIVSPPEIHDFLDTLIVAPMTTGSGPAPYRIDTIFDEKENRILLEQIRAIDRKCLLRKLGGLDRKTFELVLGTLRQMFAE